MHIGFKFLSRRMVFTDRSSVHATIVILVVIFSKALVAQPDLIHSGPHTYCLNGKWGDNCTNICPTCKIPLCQWDTGLCPYKGCEPRMYGVNCSIPCSVNCGGPNKSCDDLNGICNYGCEPGYTGPKCLEVHSCPKGQWGGGCINICRSTCKDRLCNASDGKCFKCEIGKAMPWCSRDCSNNTWGVNCSERCPPCEHLTPRCDPVTGECLGSVRMVAKDIIEDSKVKIHIAISIICFSVVMTAVPLAIFLTKKEQLNRKSHAVEKKGEDGAEDDTFQRHLRASQTASNVEVPSEALSSSSTPTSPHATASSVFITVASLQSAERESNALNK